MRFDVLETVAALVPDAGGPDCVVVAIDGVDGVGKTTFANALAERIRLRGRPTVRVGIDGFHRPRVERYRQGRGSPDGFYEDSYDYDRFRADVLVPLGAGGDRWFRPAAHDLDSDRSLTSPPRRADPSSAVIVDGIFLQRPELADAWHLTVFLDAPFAETVRRMSARDGTPAHPGHPDMARYVEGQQRYLAECRPRERASVLIDNTSPERPILLRPAGTACR